MRAIPLKALSSARRCLEALMDDEATITRTSKTVSASGVEVPGTPTTIATLVPCTLNDVSQQEIQEFMGGKQAVGPVEVTMPHDTNLRERDRLTVSGVDYEVVAVQSRRTDSFLLFAWAVEVS